MTEQRAKQVAQIINTAYTTNQAEAQRHGNTWIVALGPDYGKWYPILHDLIKMIVEVTKDSLGYTVGFSPPSKVASIHFHDYPQL